MESKNYKYDTLEEIIIENDNLEIVETTSSRTGYPQAIKKAVIGFKKFEEAEEACRQCEEQLMITVFDKKAGWQLWHRGGSVYEPFNMLIENNNTIFQIKAGEYKAFREFYKRLILDDYSDPNSCHYWAERAREMWRDYSNAKEGEYLIIECDDYWDIVPATAMSYVDDANSEYFAIGVERF